MWQALNEIAPEASSHRLQVPGGWIVRTIVKYYQSTGDGAGGGCAVEQTFVSDPNHEWKIEP